MAPFALGADGALDSFFSLPEIPDTPDGLLGDVGRAVMESMASAALDFFSNSFLGTMGTPTGSIASGEIQQMVRQRMRAFGWGDEHWPALRSLISRESSWNPTAQNPNSTAFGLFQFLDSTWGGTGIAKTSDPGLQTEAGLRYIRNRYGDPSAAWQHWLARVPINGQDMGHWYRTGGIFDQPSVIGVGEAGPEAVIPLDARGARFMSQLINETASRAGIESGASQDSDVRQFLRDLGRQASNVNTNVGETRISIDNTFNQSVQSPAQIQQIARAVVNLLGQQMSGSARSSQVTPHLVRST
jgi:SLT domain-containing protein